MDESTPDRDSKAVPEGAAVSRSFVLVVRVLVLLAALGAVAAAVLIARRGQEQAASVRYACPMHPEVRSSAPGACPICRMDLERIDHAGDDGAGHAGQGAASMPDMRAVENVRKHRILDFVRMRSLLPSIQELRGAAFVGGDGVITAVMYKDQADALGPDEAGVFTPSQTPAATVAVRRTLDAPEATNDPTSATVLLRFRVASAVAAAAPPIGTAGWVEIPRKLRSVVGVPVSALVYSPAGPYVLVTAPGGRFDKRPLTIGETFAKQGFAVALAGLHAQDRVVARASFFIEAERRQGGGGPAPAPEPGPMAP